MTQRMFAVNVHTPEHILLVGERLGVRRLRTVMLRRAVGGWRGFVRARLQGHMRHVHHTSYDVGEDHARYGVDALGRETLVLGRYPVADMVHRHQPDTVESLRRLLASVFLYRDDAEQAERDLLRSGVVQLERTVHPSG